jgi:hypothetical protein
MIIIFALFYGFRYNVGRDYLAYYDIFRNIENSGWLEPGYYWLQILLSNFPYFYLKFAIGLIIHFCVFDVLYRFRSLDFFTVTIWLIMPFGFIFVANGVRQGIAVAIGMFALSYSNKKVIASIGLIAAFMFHYSALFLWPLFIILSIGKGNIRSTILFLLLGFSVLVGIDLLANTKYGIYVTLDVFNQSNARTSLGFIAWIVILLFLVGFNRNNDFRTRSVLGSVVLRILFLHKMMLYRLIVYLEPLALLSIGSMQKLNPRSRAFFKVLVLVVFSVLFAKSYFVEDYYIPYAFSYLR